MKRILVTALACSLLPVMALAQSTDGLKIGVDMSLDHARQRMLDEIKPEIILVCSGVRVESFRSPQFDGWPKSIFFYPNNQLQKQQLQNNDPEYSA